MRLAHRSVAPARPKILQEGSQDPESKVSAKNALATRNYSQLRADLRAESTPERSFEIIT